MKDYTDTVAVRLAETGRNYQALADRPADIARIGVLIGTRMKQGAMTMFCGNGGSAADAQHLAAELQGKFLHDRKPMSSIALTANTSTLTAIANDYSYEEVFDRQVIGLGREGDVLVSMSTSGDSVNLLRAIAAARSKGIYTLGITGATGGAMRESCDDIICVPSTHTMRIQEMHIGVGHILCEIIEEIVM